MPLSFIGWDLCRRGACEGPVAVMCEAISDACQQICEEILQPLQLTALTALQLKALTKKENHNLIQYIYIYRGLAARGDAKHPFLEAVQRIQNRAIVIDAFCIQPCSSTTAILQKPGLQEYKTLAADLPICKNCRSCCCGAWRWPAGSQPEIFNSF